MLNMNKKKFTGGKGKTPVRAEFCLNMSEGFGPSMKNTSMSPDSEMKCASTCGTSEDVLNLSTKARNIP